MEFMKLDALDLSALSRFSGPEYRWRAVACTSFILSLALLSSGSPVAADLLPAQTASQQEARDVTIYFRGDAAAKEADDLIKEAFKDVKIEPVPGTFDRHLSGPRKQVDAAVELLRARGLTIPGLLTRIVEVKSDQAGTITEVLKNLAPHVTVVRRIKKDSATEKPEPEEKPESKDTTILILAGPEAEVIAAEEAVRVIGTAKIVDEKPKPEDKPKGIYVIYPLQYLTPDEAKTFLDQVLPDVFVKTGASYTGPPVQGEGSRTDTITVIEGTIPQSNTNAGGKSNSQSPSRAADMPGSVQSSPSTSMPTESAGAEKDATVNTPPKTNDRQTGKPGADPKMANYETVSSSTVVRPVYGRKKPYYRPDIPTRDGTIPPVARLAPAILGQVTTSTRRKEDNNQPIPPFEIEIRLPAEQRANSADLASVEAYIGFWRRHTNYPNERDSLTDHTKAGETRLVIRATREQVEELRTNLLKYDYILPVESLPRPTQAFTFIRSKDGMLHILLRPSGAKPIQDFFSALEQRNVADDEKVRIVPPSAGNVSPPFPADEDFGLQHITLEGTYDALYNALGLAQEKGFLILVSRYSIKPLPDQFAAAMAYFQDPARQGEFLVVRVDDKKPDDDKIRSLTILATEASMQTARNGAEAEGILLPDDSGGVPFILLAGETERVEKAVAFLRKVDIAPPQVLLEARLLELSPQQLNNLGILWNDPTTGGVLGTAKFTEIPRTKDSAIRFGSFNRSALEINATINALQLNGDTRILSSPSVTVINNKQARLFSGQKVLTPLADIDTQGRTILKLVQQDIGVTLVVQPTVNLRDSSVTIYLKPSVSSIIDFIKSTNGASLAQVSTRDAETTVRIPSGEMLAIGGLITEEEVRSIQKVPLLGDLPLIGELFRNRRLQKRRTELVLLLQPQIVTGKNRIPTSPNADNIPMPRPSIPPTVPKLPDEERQSRAIP
jgi:type II secretory pathway component GspD/PulD (secretin)